MKLLKKAGMVLLFVLPAIIGFAGYVRAGEELFDAAYLAIRMYLFDADSRKNNLMIEIARWVAPIFTVSGLAIMLKTAFAKVVDFFAGFATDAVAVYGDTEIKAIVAKNIKHAINVDDNEAMDVGRHIIMFSTDEKGLEFYTKNKDKLNGEVFMKIDKNDTFVVSLDNVKFFNPCEIIARSFWQEHDISRVLDKDELKIAIVGSDVLSRKILTYGLLNNIYSLTQKVEYHIWSDDNFFEKAHSDFVTMNGDKIVYHNNKCMRRIFDIASADRIIITEAIDNEFLGEIVELTEGEIYCFDPIGTFVNVFDYKKIYSFGRYSEVLTEENIRTDKLYNFAKELNHQYALKYLKEGQTKIPTIDEAWDELNVFLKGSNIASADHHKIRLIVMRKSGKTKVDDILAEMEHIRWCRYHYLNHWKFGETTDGNKDSKNKIHPCLKPFADLPESNKQKDRDGIETLLSLEGLE